MKKHRINWPVAALYTAVAMGIPGGAKLYIDIKTKREAIESIYDETRSLIKTVNRMQKFIPPDLDISTLASDLHSKNLGAYVLLDGIRNLDKICPAFNQLRASYLNVAAVKLPSVTATTEEEQRDLQAVKDELQTYRTQNSNAQKTCALNPG